MSDELNLGNMNWCKDTIESLRQQLADCEATDKNGYDMRMVIRLTHQKTKHIIERDGFSVTGFVLTHEDDRKCIVDMSAVLWFHEKDGLGFFRMMHPDNPPSNTATPDEVLQQLEDARLLNEHLTQKCNEYIAANARLSEQCSAEHEGASHVDKTNEATLLEQLRAIRKDAVGSYVESVHAVHHVPYGILAHKAADAITSLNLKLKLANKNIQTANFQTEEFERKWYLETDKTECLTKQLADVKPPIWPVLVYDGGNDIRVEATKNIRGETKWKIKDPFGNVLNSNGEWEYELRPSGRDDEFLNRCRYESADQAFHVLNQKGVIDESE